MPVLEALLDTRVAIRRITVARGAQGDSMERILAAAQERGLVVHRSDSGRVTRISGNGRHDQGVVAEVTSPGLAELGGWLGDRPAPDAVELLLLDGLTNPANVGMIIRSAVAAGIGAVVLPRAGSPDLGPLVVKASAGVAFFAPVLRSDTAAMAAETLRAGGVALVGLAGDTRSPDARARARTASIWDARWPPRVAFVLGNETEGVSAPVAGAVTSWCSIPLANGVESLNVAAAAAIVAFEVARRRAGR